MPPTTGPNLGLQHSWDARESGWKAGMDDNLKLLDAVVQLAVLDKDLATPPGSPSTGDRYIVAASATGAWAGQEEAIALWNGTAWVFFTPTPGWWCYVQDEDIHYRYNAASNWVLVG